MVTVNAESSGTLFAYVLFAMKPKNGRENGNRDEKGRRGNLILALHHLVEIKYQLGRENHQLLLLLPGSSST